MERSIFLSGMMGSGKTTVGRALASSLGVTFVDLDARVESRAGKPVAAIFADDGEAAFRSMEAEEAMRLLSEPPKVVALGGGTVTSEAVRRRLLESGVLVTLWADLSVLLERVGASEARPLLSGAQRRATLRRLLDSRSASYAECHSRLDTSTLEPSDLAASILEIAARRQVVVPLGERTYRVELRDGALADLPDRIASLAPSHVVAVTDQNVGPLWAERIVARLAAPSSLVVLPAGERHKTIRAVETIWDAALAVPVDRDALVLAIGGGVVGDLAGFAAATVLRGVSFAQCPTSLLAMADASVGGKTGFDHAGGKNLVGAFHQPQLVVCAIETLSTLPDEELRSGLGEVIKAAWLDSEAAVARLEADAAALLGRDPRALGDAVEMAVRLKARVVAEDERESGRRATLNLGHTLGHAIEAAHDFSGVRHGEAVGLGMLAAFRVAEGLGVPAAAEQGARMAALLSNLGLPTDVDAHLDARTFELMGTDKKRRGGAVRFVVPGPPSQVTIEELDLGRVANLVRRPRWQ